MTSPPFRVFRVFVATLFFAIPLAAQSSSFEVASVKQNKSGSRGGILRILPGGRVTVTNFSVRQLINFGWQLAGFQVVGGPEWTNDDAYDIVAKLDGEYVPVAPGTGQADPLQLAMRNLLEDRFKLKTHRETREMDIYALVLARPGTHGPKLIQSPMDCAAQAQAERAKGGPPAPMPTRPPALGTPYCGVFGGPGRLRSGGLNANMIAQSLMPAAGRMVVNRTGLEGSWDFELSYAQPQRGPGPDAAAVDPNAPDFFTAVQEQLGLKLESAKGPVEVLVIDGAERPAED
jgi:uncharacterized protein (TIGR03435 family)